MQAVLASLQQTQMIVMGVVLTLLVAAESAHPFFEYFRSTSRERGRHLGRNLAVGALNGLVVSGVFVALWLGAAVWADQRGIGVLNWLTEAGLPGWAHAVGAVILLDAWMYVWHRLNHVIPFLWRFHRVHHADRHLDVSTAHRFHVGEIVFSSMLRIPLIVLAGLYAWELVLYETVMFAIVQFHHANVKLPDWLDRGLRILIVSPDMHKIHHSRHRPETDSNYSSLFSVWDRIGRTFRFRRQISSLEIGLDGFDEEETYHTLWGILKTPFIRPPTPEEDGNPTSDGTETADRRRGGNEQPRTEQGSA